jgi:hypothetical protein
LSIARYHCGLVCRAKPAPIQRAIFTGFAFQRAAAYNRVIIGYFNNIATYVCHIFIFLFGL